MPTIRESGSAYFGNLDRQAERVTDQVEEHPPLVWRRLRPRAAGLEPDRRGLRLVQAVDGRVDARPPIRAVVPVALPTAEQTLLGHSPRYGAVTVSAWHGLHR